MQIDLKKCGDTFWFPKRNATIEAREASEGKRLKL